MSGILWCGHDLGDLCDIELLEPAALSLEARTAEICGRGARAVLSVAPAPRVIRARLMMKTGPSPDIGAFMGARRQIAGTLFGRQPGELTVVDDGMVYRDVVVTACDGWGTMLDSSTCTVEFTAFDPFAYGEERSSAEVQFSTGGSAPTWPRFELTATAGSEVRVAYSDGRYVALERGFGAGDAVAMDFADQTVTVNGADARADIALESSFFPLAPGQALLAFTGCSSHVTTWDERWA